MSFSPPPKPSFFGNVARGAPVAPSYTTPIPSLPTDAKNAPSSEKRTQLAKLPCLCRTPANANGGPSKKPTVKSSDAAAILNGRFGRNATEFTRLVAPLMSPTLDPESHRNARANAPPRPSPHATSRWPSALHWMSSTAPLKTRCSALRVWSSFRPQIRTTPLASPLATHSPFGETRATVVGYWWPS